MKLMRSAAAAIACIVVIASAFGTYAMSSETDIREISAASYDSSELTDYAGQIAAIVNSEREARGLTALKVSPKLSAAANTRAAELTRSFSHTRPDGSSCFTAITDIGLTYGYAAENIAYGQKSPQSVMNAWMNSAGHRANILNENMEYIGVGVYYENGVYYWSQFFASSADEDNGYLPAPETPAETTVTDAPEKEPEPSDTTVTEKEPAADPVPDETRKPEETKAPDVMEKPQETTVPSESKKPETDAPAETAPGETKCTVNSDGSISCTPSVPCETQCTVNSDGSISCTPSVPCETQCTVNSDGSISCTPSVPCETQCTVNCDGSISCTPENSCGTNSAGNASCGQNNAGTDTGCPLTGTVQGQNVLEWLLPRIMNSGSCNSSSGNCGTNDRISAGNSSDSGCWGDQVSSGAPSCWGNSIYQDNSACNGNYVNSSGSGCWGNSADNNYQCNSGNTVNSVGSCWGN